MKFLRKSSVLKDCWVHDSEMGVVPMEIQLLARLAHPSIVQVWVFVCLFVFCLVKCWSCFSERAQLTRLAVHFATH